MAGAALLAGLAESAAEAEVGEVVDRVGFDDGLELDRGRGEAAGAEVGAPQRLADRGLLGGAAGGLGKGRGGGREGAVLQQPAAGAGEGGGGRGGARRAASARGAVACSKSPSSSSSRPRR